MIRVNLLPHREEARKLRRQQFYTLAGLVVVLAALIVFFVYTVIAGYAASQESSNAFLKREVASLDTEIEEIKRLKEQTQALLARKQVIESLQKDRGETVHLLSELALQMPEGVYIKSIKQAGADVSITGVAQSNAKVSALMRNIESSQWIGKPTLLEVKSATVDRRRLNEFSMTFKLIRKQGETGKEQK
jgi:type IV pilus assembly protein PilN